MTTWGNVDDYRHFLPRIAELISSGQAGGSYGVDLDMVGNKLAYAKWRAWPDEEQRAIEEWLLALWGAHVEERSADPEWDPESAMLRSLVRITGDDEVYLRVWLADGDVRQS